MQITVFGAGYVGVVSAACMARLNHSVSLYDVDANRVRLLQRAEAPFHEPDLPNLLEEVIAAGSLRAVDQVEDALSHADVVLVCVGTPLGPDGAADLRQIESASRILARVPMELPIVLRSTLPVGSTFAVAERLGRPDGENIVTNPEFLRQGSAVSDFLRPTRIVVGTPAGRQTAAADTLLSLYAAIEAPRIITDFNSAEVIKNASNAFLAAKLSFINEIADLCEVYDANVDDVVLGMGLDPRIGPTYLQPGIGFGGSCLPKELANLVNLGNQRGLSLPLMTGAAQTNEGRADKIADRLEEVIGSLKDCRVAILGLAFKPNTDDTRRSPSIALARTLLKRGAAVRAHDPVVKATVADASDIIRADTPEAAMADADLVILATEWPEYADLPWASLASRVRRPILFDGRNATDSQSLAVSGWQVIRVGQAAAAHHDTAAEDPIA